MSNCTVLRWSKPFERMCYDVFLKPNIHYFLVDENNLLSTIKFALDNPYICEKMINDRKEIMYKYLSLNTMKENAIKQIHDYINIFFNLHKCIK